MIIKLVNLYNLHIPIYSLISREQIIYDNHRSKLIIESVHLYFANFFFAIDIKNILSTGRSSIPTFTNKTYKVKRKGFCQIVKDVIPKDSWVHVCTK